jgi:hypothetical protein
MRIFSLESLLRINEEGLLKIDKIGKTHPGWELILMEITRSYMDKIVTFWLRANQPALLITKHFHHLRHAFRP